MVELFVCPRMITKRHDTTGSHWPQQRLRALYFPCHASYRNLSHPTFWCFRVLCTTLSMNILPLPKEAAKAIRQQGRLLAHEYHKMVDPGKGSNRLQRSV